MELFAIFQICLPQQFLLLTTERQKVTLSYYGVNRISKFDTV